MKKTGDPDFDVAIGIFDGAELCEPVGLFILNTLIRNYGLNTSGFYRDDGLCCFHKISGPQSERIKEELLKLLKVEFGMNITIDTNLKMVNFLEVTFNLLRGTFQPYTKTNSQQTYISVNPI